MGGNRSGTLSHEAKSSEEEQMLGNGTLGESVGEYAEAAVVTALSLFLLGFALFWDPHLVTQGGFLGGDLPRSGLAIAGLRPSFRVSPRAFFPFTQDLSVPGLPTGDPRGTSRPSYPVWVIVSERIA